MKSFTKQNVLHLTPDVVHLQMTDHQSATKMFLGIGDIRENNYRCFGLAVTSKLDFEPVFPVLSNNATGGWLLSCLFIIIRK